MARRYSYGVLFVGGLQVVSICNNFIHSTKNRKSIFCNDLVSLSRFPYNLKICSTSSCLSQPEDYETLKNFVIPHEGFAWEADFGEWTRAWEDHNFHPDDDGCLPYSLKGPADGYTCPVDAEEFLANLATLEPYEEDCISYGDVFEPMDPEAIRHYQKVAQESKSYAVEHMSNMLSPFRLYSNEQTTRQQQQQQALDIIELTEVHKLWDTLSHRKWYGWKYIFDAKGVLENRSDCYFSIQLIEDTENSLYIYISEEWKYDYIHKVPLHSFVQSPKLDAFSWIETNSNETLLFFGFLLESLTIVKLKYDQNDALCNICIWYGEHERTDLEASKCLLKEEALRGTWKGEGFAIQSCSFPSCCAIQSKSEWKWELPNINELTVRRNLPLKDPQYVDPSTKLNKQQKLKGERKAARKREMELVSDCCWWKISQIGIHVDCSVGRKVVKNNSSETEIESHSVLYEFPALGKYEKDRYFFLLPCDIFVFIPLSFLSCGVFFELEVGQYRNKSLCRIVHSYNIERDWVGCAILEECKY